jgi:type I restriction enzyme M protein
MDTGEWLEDESNLGKPFPTFARLLSRRGTPEGESRYSWTVDFAARRARAREEMQPHLDEAEAIKAEVVGLKETLKARKKNGAESAAIEALEQEIKAREKAAREALAKAGAIDAAVFDLKAVNPNAAAKTDTRTPAEIIAGIEAQGEIVSAALSNLKKLLAEPD